MQPVVQPELLARQRGRCNGCCCSRFPPSSRRCSSSRGCRPHCWSGRCWRRSSPASTAPRSGRTRIVFMAAQAIVGCLIATSIEPEIFASFLAEWPLFLGIVLATLMASSLLGYLISRWKVLPGTTAVWGSTPGAASAMVLMADAFGADARLVAFMQYLRVIFVSIAAAVIARLWVDTSGVAGRRSSGSRRSTGRPLPRRIADRGGRRGGRPRCQAAGRHLPRADDPRHGAASWRLCRAAAAAMAAGGELCRDRLVDRPQFHAHDPQARGPRPAADHRLDRRADRLLRGARLCHEPRARHRPADRLSGDQPRRHGFGRHHRGGVRTAWTSPSSWRCRRRAS